MGNKDGAYEADIQQTLSEVFRLLTPFVCAEPCRGYADHIVYINDETLTPWIHRTLQQRGDLIRAACTYYHHSENRCSQGNTPGPCAGSHCRRYQQLQQTRDRLKSSFPPGIHLVEVKSNHDNVNRFGYQLPHYCLFADYIWLAMEDHQPPDWLPPFIGILRYHHDVDTITIEGEAAKIDRVPHLDERIIQEAHPHVKSIENSGAFISFLRAWFINSIFNDGHGNYIIDMPNPAKLLTLQKDHSTAGRLTETTLTQFTE